MTIADLFREQFGSAPDICVRAPGRVNLIGEHIDYSGGLVLPFAIGHAAYLAARRRDDALFRLVSAQFNGEYLGPAPDEKTSSWTDYVFGVVREFQKLGLSVPGLDIFVDGTVPRGSGLSSSASLEVAAAWAIQELIGSTLARQEIALLGQRAENAFVGVNCGVMDQTASACCAKRHALLLNCDTLESEQIPLALGDAAAIIVAHSGVRRGLSASAYNERRSQCEAALAAIRSRASREVPFLCDAKMDELEAARPDLSPTVFRRGRHAISEQQRTLETAQCLRNCEWERAGDLLDESHRSLREDYEVSCPELDELTDFVRSQKGAYGSRLTGAGFGGCAISIVSAREAKNIVENLKTKYYFSKGLTPIAFLTEAEDGVKAL